MVSRKRKEDVLTVVNQGILLKTVMLEKEVKRLWGVGTSSLDYVQDAGEERIGQMNAAPRLMMIIQCPLGRETSDRASPGPTKQ